MALDSVARGVSNSQGIYRQETAVPHILRIFDALICSTGPVPFSCPVGTQIQIERALYGPQRILLTKTIEKNITNYLCEFPSNTKQYNSANVNAECMKYRDVTTPMKQLCEHGSSCAISPSQFSKRQSDCSTLNNHIYVTYQCEPSHPSIKKDLICADTYVELKCGSYRPADVIIITGARYTNDPSTQKCNIDEKISEEADCLTNLEVTDRLQVLCDNQKSCSVMPDASSILPKDRSLSCGKLHLQLTYACVPTVVLVNRESVERNLDSTLPTEKIRKKKRPKINSEEATSAQQSNEENYLKSKTFAKVNVSYVRGIESNQGMRTPVENEMTPSSHSTSLNFSSLIFGLVVAFVLLIILILLVIVFGLRSCRSAAGKSKFTLNYPRAGKRELCPSRTHFQMGRENQFMALRPQKLGTLRRSNYADFGDHKEKIGIRFSPEYQENDHNQVDTAIEQSTMKRFQEYFGSNGRTSSEMSTTDGGSQSYAQLSPDGNYSTIRRTVPAPNPPFCEHPENPTALSEHEENFILQRSCSLRDESAMNKRNDQYAENVCNVQEVFLSSDESTESEDKPDVLQSESQNIMASSVKPTCIDEDYPCPSKIDSDSVGNVPNISNIKFEEPVMCSRWSEYPTNKNSGNCNFQIKFVREKPLQEASSIAPESVTNLANYLLYPSNSFRNFQRTENEKMGRSVTLEITGRHTSSPVLPPKVLNANRKQNKDNLKWTYQSFSFK